MITALLIKIYIGILNLYADWIPSWQIPDGLATAYTYMIYYGKYIGIWINTDAFWGSIAYVIQTLLFVVSIKGAIKFYGYVRGFNAEI